MRRIDHISPAGIRRVGLLALACTGAMVMSLVLIGQTAASVPGQNGAILFSQPSEGLFSLNPKSGSIGNLTDFPSNDVEPASSPDGSRVVYVGPDQNLYSLAPGDPAAPPQQLTTDGSNHSPVYTPDGKSIIYFHERLITRFPKGEDENDLTEIPASGGESKVLSTIPGFTGAIDVSPDGKLIAFGDPDIEILNRDGSGRRDIAFDGFDPSFSPDGTHIAFSRYVGTTLQIATMRTDGSHSRVLTTDPSGSGQPEYSPDGTRIAFTGERGGIFTVKPDGSSLRRISGITGYLGAWTRKAPFLIKKFSSTILVDPPRVVKSTSYGARVFGPGRLRIWGPDIQTQSHRFSEGGRVEIRFRKKFVNRLVRNGVAKLTVRGTFRPDGGLPSTLEQTLVVSLRG